MLLLFGKRRCKTIALRGRYQSELGVIGTPVIDPSTNTMYLVSAEVQKAPTSTGCTPWT